MALPSITELRRPVLEAHADGQALQVAEIVGRLAPVFELTAEELATQQRSGDNTMVQRVGWARTNLVRLGLLEQPERGTSVITDLGRQTLEAGDPVGVPRTDWASEPVSRESVLAAIELFDREGHDAVLRRHRYSRALDYVVVHADREYSAVGLYGVAYGIQYPDAVPIRNRGIGSGREVGRLLEPLGLTISSRRERGERVWLIRAGGDGEYERLALDEGASVIGWSSLGRIGLEESREDLKRRVSETWNEHRPMALAAAAGQIHRFIHEVKTGDLVVLPFKRRRGHVAVGRLAGEYEHRTEGPFAGTDAQNTRAVDWLAPDLPYERFDPDLREAFGQQGTLSEISKPESARRILEIVGGEDASAIHAVLEAAPDTEVDLSGIAAAWAGKLRAQIDQGSTTFVFLRDQDAAWRGRIVALDTDIAQLADLAQVEPAELTDGYVDAQTGEPLALDERGVRVVRRASGVSMGRYFIFSSALGPFDSLPPADGFVYFDDGEYVGAGGQGEDYEPFARPVPAAQGPQRTLDLDAQPITRGQFDRLVQAGRGVADFGLDSVRRAAEERGLTLAPEIYAQVVAALTSGKHVILTGPPGTAKTTLAGAVADAARAAGECDGYLLTTATADWTTYETIGGLRPTGPNALEFEEGHFLKAIRDRQWLVIDELNRSHFDRAFGQLFTVLSGQPVVLPHRRRGADGPLALLPHGVAPPTAGLDVLEIPRSWRVIATMNVFDKTLLFEMSFALMRRFAFIEVASPSEAVFEALIERECGGDPRAARLATQLLELRELSDLGPAVFMDLAKYLRQRIAVADADDGQLLFEAFYSYLLPQFEGIDALRGERLNELVSARLGSAALRERLRRTLNAVLGLELTQPRTAEHEPEA